jgi:hypothetical protein
VQQTTATLHSLQPILTCMQLVLFGVQPGLRLANEPAAICAPPQARALPWFAIGMATLAAAAAPAVAMVAAAAASTQPPGWARQVPGHAWMWEHAVDASTHLRRCSSTNTTDVDPAAHGTSIKPLARPTTPTPSTEASAIVPLRQQVAFAKDLMLQMRGCLWHGLDTHTSGSPAQPGVFHVVASAGELALMSFASHGGPPALRAPPCSRPTLRSLPRCCRATSHGTVTYNRALYADGTILDIMPLSKQAQRLLPKLPISDSIYSDTTVKKLRGWRAETHNPCSQAFDPEARPPATPRRKHNDPADAAFVLEVTVYPDAAVEQASNSKTGTSLLVGSLDCCCVAQRAMSIHATACAGQILDGVPWCGGWRRAQKRRLGREPVRTR